MTTKPDARQIISRDTLTQIANNAANKELDDLFRSIDSELANPLRMLPTATPNRTVNIQNILVTNPEHGRRRTIPPISNLIPTFVSGTVTLPAASGGNITNNTGGPAVVLTLATSEFLKVGLNLNALGQIQITLGLAGATEALATAPAVPTNTFAIGYIVAENIGGTIQNVTNARIVQYEGGGGGGGSGDSSSVTETIKNTLVDSIYELATANIASVDAATLIASFGGTASNSLTDSAFKFAAAADSITSIQMLDSLEFLDEEIDVNRVALSAFWKTGSVDTAAVYELSRDGGAHYQTITMARVGDGTNAYQGDYQWAREEENTASVANTAATSIYKMTDNAGINEASAQRFSFAATTRATTLLIRLIRLGTIGGNWRLALYTASGSAPGSMYFATPWQSANAVPTTETDYPIDVSAYNLSFAAGVSYFMVIETDAAYKATYLSATNYLAPRINATGTNEFYSLDNGVWSVLASFRMIFTVTGGQESFATVSTYSVANAVATKALNTSTEQRLAQPIILATAQVVKKVTLYLNITGTPAGTIKASIYRNSAGDPGGLTSDLVTESSLVTITGFGTGNVVAAFTLPTTTLAPGTYWIVLSAAGGYTTGVAWRTDNTSPTADGVMEAYDGTVWTPQANEAGTYLLEGRPLDLRVRITSSAGSKLLEGYAVYYAPQLEVTTQLNNNRTVAQFNSSTGNLSSFAMPFLPNSELLKVYWVEAGQVFTYPAFDIQGYTVVFPTNSFYDAAGLTVTLVFDQGNGGAYDNSDRNASLLVANHLGSTDGTVDRSAPGRGVFLRRPDGTLREIALDDSDNIVVYSV